MTSPLRKFALAAGLVTMGFAVAPAGARAQDGEPTPPVPADDVVDTIDCTLVSASVNAGTAFFTVGPAGCEGVVGPLSFSAFNLPGGMRVPFEAQQLIAHHGANGSTYPAGTYVLTLDLGDACNWQTDLYRGGSAVPIFGDKLIDADYREGRECDDETTTTTIGDDDDETTTTTIGDDEGETTTTTIGDDDDGETTTTIAGGDGGETTTTTTEVASGGPTTTQAGDDGETTTTTTEVASGGPTTSDVASGGATAGDVASGGPPPVQVAGAGGAQSPAANGGALPATGASESLMISLLGGTLIGFGALARRMARS